MFEIVLEISHSRTEELYNFWFNYLDNKKRRA